MITAALALNSLIFSALALNFLAATCGYHWPSVFSRLRQEWLCAVIMAACGFLLLLLIPAVLLFFRPKRAGRVRAHELST